jgi:hypothetical protein
MGEFDEAPGSAAAGEYGDDVDGFGDQGAGHRDDGFLDELLKAPEGTCSGPSVDGADAPGMAGRPRFKQVKSFRPANLADRNPVGSKA